MKNFGYSDYCVNASDDELIIGCEFDELPEKLIIDTSAETTLAYEYLLNSNNNLEILKVYTNKGESLSTAKIYVRAMHPSHKDCNNLLSLKINDLKKQPINIASHLQKIRRLNLSGGKLYGTIFQTT